MARRKKTKKRSQRKANDFTKISDLLGPKYLKDTIRRADSFKIGDDRRRFRPETDREVRRIDGRKVSYEESRPKSRSGRLLPGKIAFTDSKRVTVCARRRNRRVALFKQQKIGKGRSVSKIRKYNENSKIKCNRR